PDIDQMLLASTMRKPIAHRILRNVILVWPPRRLISALQYLLARAAPSARSRSVRHRAALRQSEGAYLWWYRPAARRDHRNRTPRSHDLAPAGGLAGIA